METGLSPRINIVYCDSVVFLVEKVAFSVLHVKLFRF